MMLPNGDQLLYHVTRKENLPDILANGIQPRIGPRSLAANEPEPKIYLFRRKDDMENAVMNWLGELFDDSAELVALKIQMPVGFAKWLAFNIDTPYELTYDKIIPAKWIKSWTDV